MNRKKLIVGGLVAFVLLAIGGYFGGHFALVKYHRYQLIASYSAASKAGPSDPNHTAFMREYERQRNALLSLGYFTKQQFYLHKLSAHSAAYRELLQKLAQRFPTSIGKIDAHGYIFGEPTFIILWVYPEDAKQIEQFVSEHDL